MIAAALLVAGIGGYLFRLTGRDPDRVRKVERWLLHKRRWGKLLLISGGVVLCCALVLLVSIRETFYVTAPPLARGVSEQVAAYYVDLAYWEIENYLDRALPLVVLMFGIGLQTLVLLPVMCFGLEGLLRKPGSKGFYFFCGVYGAALIAWGLLGGLRLRMEMDVLGWNPQTSPVTDVHVGLAVFLGLGLLLLVRGRRVEPSPGRRIRADLIIFILLWLGAALYWQSIPLQSSWFLAPPRAPNFEHYPNSDALIYDRTAASLATGSGFRTYSDPTIVRRPMYTFFLALLHILSREEYETVLRLQSALLAVFPALAYLLTRDLSNRFAGILVAVLAILREGTALGTAGFITISTTKLSMSDFPMAVGIILFTLLALRALDPRPREALFALLAGGVMGIFILVRMEVGVLIGVMIAVSYFALRPSWRQWLLRAGLLMAGAMLVLSPWLYRNWHLTGQVYLEIPGNRINFVIQRLTRPPPPENQPPGPEEEPQELEEGGRNPEVPGPRTVAAPVPGSGPVFRARAGAVPAAAYQESGGPSTTFAKIANHFLHSNVQFFLTLPTIFRGVDAVAGATQHQSGERLYEACCDSIEYIRRLQYWQWYEWEGDLPVESVPLILVNLLFISLGIGNAWVNHRWKALLPLLFAEAYALVLAVARTSGGRYLLPVDWTLVMYYGIGLAQVLQWVARLAGRRALSSWLTTPAPIDPLPGAPATARNSRTWLAAGVGILLIGTALPASEIVIPRNITDGAPQPLMEALAVTDGATAELLSATLMNGGEVLMGQAFYPRLYGVGIGEEEAENEFTKAREFERLTFLLIGKEFTGVVLPLDRFPEVDVPNGVNVLVIGCPAENYFDAAVVFFPDTGRALVRSPLPTGPGCPLTPPD